MRVGMAYFAGAGTVIAAIGLGLGGGLTIANVLSPHQEKLEQTKLEQRMSVKPIPPSAQADQPKQQAEQEKPAVPYVAATNAAITANTPAAASQPQPQTQAAAPAQQTQPPATQSAPQPTEAKVAHETVKPAEEPAAKPQTAAREQASSSSEDKTAKPSSSGDKTARASSPEDANATAREPDLKRLAAEKRKAERRQKWAERRKAREQRDAELRDSDVNVRGEGGDRPLIRDTGDGPRVRDSDGPRIVIRQDDGDFAPRRGADRRIERHSRGDSDRSDRSDRPFGFPGFNLFGADSDD